jgi:hydroxymethylpyrimidine pyrophosphatase-like HAD family hydrolase/predicted nucleotidyltransferase
VTRIARKLTAVFIAAALVLVSPGTQAFAQVVNSGSRAQAGVPAGAPTGPSASAAVPALAMPSALNLAPALSFSGAPVPVLGAVAAPAALAAGLAPSLPLPLAAASIDPAKPSSPVPAARPVAAPKPIDSPLAYALHRGLLRAVDALGGGLRSLRPAGAALTELKIAAAADSRGVFADYDETLSGSNAAFNNKLSPDMVEAVRAVKAAGKTVDVISDRPESVFESLSTLPVETRAGMYVAVDAGGRVYRYDAEGKPALVYEAPAMTEETKALLSAAGDAAMKRLPGGSEAVLRQYTYTIKLKVGSTWEQVRGAGEIFQKELSRRGSPLSVRARMAKDPANNPYLVVSVNTKANASRFIAAQRKLAGKDIVILGDGMFASRQGGGNENDAAMLDGAPGARMFSVGGTGDPRRKGLVVLGKSGPAASRDVLLAVASKPLAAALAPAETRRSAIHELRLWISSLRHYFIEVNVENWREYRALRASALPVSEGKASVSDARGFFVDSRMMGMIGGVRTVGSRSGSDAYVTAEAIKLFDRYFDVAGSDEARPAFLAFLDRAVLYNPMRSSSNLRKHIRKALHAASILAPSDMKAHFDKLMGPEVNAGAAEFQNDGAQRVLDLFRAAVSATVAEEDASAADRVVGVVLLGSFATGAATPTSDFDLHVLTANGSSRRVPAFVERVEKRWSENADSKSHPVNGADFGFMPSRPMLLGMHHDRFLVISPDQELERSLSPPGAATDRAPPEEPTAFKRAEWKFYNGLLRLATRIDDVKTAASGRTVSSLDDATRKKALTGWLVGRSLYLIGFILAGVISYPMLAQALVGSQGYTDLMSLGAVAAILLAPLSGLVADKLSFRNMFALNGVIRVGLALAIPALVALGAATFWPLLAVALLTSWNVASSLVAEDKMLPALAGSDPKRLPVLNAAANLNFIGLSVILGTFLLSGRWVDALAASFGVVHGLSGMFVISAALAAAGALIQWLSIPNVALSRPAAVKPTSAQASDASASKRRNLGVWSGTLAVGGALYLALHAVVPQFAALALVGAALTGLILTSKGLARLWKNPALRTGTLLSMAYAFVVYPVGSILIPFASRDLKGGALMQGQLQGSLFFGQLLAGSTMLNLPGRWNTVVRAVVLGALGAWLGLYLFPASLAMAAAGMAIAGGLYAISTRLSDRGWMRYAFIGLSSLALPLAFWGNIPALLLGIMIIGLVNVPNKITIDTVVQREAKADGLHTGELLGVRSALAAIAAAFGYSTVGAVASGLSFPAALWPMLGAFGVIGLLLWMAPRWLGGKLAPGNFKTNADLATSAPKEHSLDELADVLAERLKSKGIKAIITDYDGTLMDKTPDDKAVVASDELVGLLRRLRKLGVTVVVSTNHFFTGDHNGMTSLLGDRLDAKTRAGMLFAVQSGARIYEYGADGSTPNEPAWKEVSFDDAERAKITPVFEAAAAKVGLKPEDYKIFHEDSRTLIELRNHPERDQALYEALAEANTANGFGYLVQLKPMPTMRHVPYVQYFKAHKGTGARKAMEMLKARGLIDDESQVAVFGDDFKPEGNDLYMAQALPGALAVSVGKTFDASQPNVMQASERGSATIRALIGRLNDMLAAREAAVK